MKKLLLLVIPFVIALSVHQANAQVQIDPASIYINNNGNYVPYILTQNATSVTVRSMEGSYIFDKNACSISFYNGTDTNHNPIIGSDVYSVLASQGSTGIWNPVSIINNAACTTSVIENAGTVTIIGTKSVSGAGIFSINYTKVPIQPLKLTFSATNQNPSWTNFHIGMSETIQVPKIISFNNYTYNLSNFNNTFLDRTWISSHNSQLINLGINTHYNMGLGWNNVNQITINWINNKAYLKIDYNFNTPILSPGQTISIDPAIASDTATFCTQASTSSISCAVTIGNNPNRVIIVKAYAGKSSSTKVTNFNTVVIGSNTFTELSGTDKSYNSAGSGNALHTGLFYLLQPPTGAQTVTLSFTNTTLTISSVGIWSLYNVNSLAAGNSSSGESNAQINVLPTRPGSWIIAGAESESGAGLTPNHTQDFNNGVNKQENGQHFTSPTIGSKNSMSWTGANLGWTAVGAEVKSAGIPSATTLSKVNTLNSTAINATWASSTGATWYWFNATLSGGATTHINTTAITKTLNNYTAGSKYTFSVVAANSTGKSSGSVTKYNYTKNIAPTSLAASVITATKERITWTNPTGNFSGFKVEKQPNHSSWSTVVSNTGNSTNHYDLSGLTPGLSYGVRISTNYAVGSNYSGTSSPSSILNFTTLQSTVANSTLNKNIVGDVVQLNATTSITAGNPSPVQLTNLKLYINGSLYNNTNLSHNIANGSSYNFTWWYQFPNANSQTFKYQATVTNFTGLPSQTTLKFNSSNLVTSRQYQPTYHMAVDPTLGTVNYTISRPTPTSIILAANRNVGGTLFPMECLYQTSSQAITGSTLGTWVNKTNVGYWYQNQAVSRSEVYYITCYDPNNELFNTKSLVNGSSVLFGIQGFDNTFGAFLGLPTGVFFIVMAAALGNRRTAPMWVVIILAIAGLMATIGFFTLDKNIWYLAIIAGLLGLFVGRKLF